MSRVVVVVHFFDKHYFFNTNLILIDLYVRLGDQGLDGEDGKIGMEGLRGFQGPDGAPGAQGEPGLSLCSK